MGGGSKSVVVRAIRGLQKCGILIRNIIVDLMGIRRRGTHILRMLHTRVVVGAVGRENIKILGNSYWFLFSSTLTRMKTPFNSEKTPELS